MKTQLENAAMALTQKKPFRPDNEMVIKNMKQIHLWFKKMKLFAPEKAEMYDMARQTIQYALDIISEQQKRIEELESGSDEK